MKVPAASGDVADRIAILRLKVERIGDASARAHVARELSAVLAAWEAHGLPPVETLAEWPGLDAVNRRLWDVEDLLRDHEARGDFGSEFVEAARSVYRLNDERAAFKRAISERLGSELVEQKAYRAPGDRSKRPVQASSG